MAAPISLRGDFDGPECFGPLFWRKRPGASPGACYLSSRSMTAARARTPARGRGLQTIRDWVLRFNFRGPDGLVDGKSTGHPARPRHHAHDEAVVAAFKKKVPDILATIAATSGKPLELWFQDEARIGQKNKVTRRWAERGTPPFALKDQRTASAYIFGAICPALGKAAGLVLPSCNTEAMTLHLQEIAVAVAPGAHAVLFVDRAGCHVTAKLGRARKHYARPPTVQVTRAQSRREHLAIHAR